MKLEKYILSKSFFSLLKEVRDEENYFRIKHNSILLDCNDAVADVF